MTDPVRTPEPPYYLVQFVFRLTGVDMAEYQEAAADLMALARKLPGFYGEDAVRQDGNICMSASYWRDEEAITEWRNDAEHIAARKIGREKWYECFELRVARVERAYGFEKKT